MLIYGLKHAVALVTKLIKPIVTYGHILGIRNSIFIDDGRVLGKTEKESKENHEKMLEILQAAGWKIQWSKTCGTPSQTLYYQGLTTSTKPLLYILPFFKKDHLKRLLLEALNSYQESKLVKCRDFAKLISTVASASQALGPVSTVLLRASHTCLSWAIDSEGWDGYLLVSQAAAGELSLLLDQLDSINGQPIILE